MAPGLLLLAGCSDPEPAAAIRHVLLISLDTTRADHLGCYGAARGSTPSIDALASQGTRFADCTAPAPTTLASHTSLMTGRHPRSHGVPRNGFVLSPENETLAEILGAAGFWCAGFLGSFALDARFGFAQGFDHFDQELDLEVGPGGRDQDQRTADAVTRAVLAHVDVVRARRDFERDGRLFLFAHYFDPHAPYAPPARMAALHGAPTTPGAGGAAAIEAAVRGQQQQAVGVARGQQSVVAGGLDAALVRGARGEPRPADEVLAALYAGEVTYTDAAVGRLLAGLEARGLLQDTLVVLTADHGETFWEHANFWNHGLWVHQTDVHVPLVVRLPDRARGARVPAVETPVSTVDVAPTVLALLGLEAPRAAQGRSLAGALAGDELAVVPVFSEATQPGRAVEDGRADAWWNQPKPRCVRLGRWKYVRAPYVGLEQLYDLWEDPGEQRDLLAGDAPAPPPVLDELRATLDAFEAGAAPLPSRFDPSQTEETRARLEALGYVEAGAPAPGQDR